jgi:hypothetical protein
MYRTEVMILMNCVEQCITVLGIAASYIQYLEFPVFVATLNWNMCVLRAERN